MTVLFHQKRRRLQLLKKAWRHFLDNSWFVWLHHGSFAREPCEREALCTISSLACCGHHSMAAEPGMVQGSSSSSWAREGPARGEPVGCCVCHLPSNTRHSVYVFLIIDWICLLIIATVSDLLLDFDVIWIANISYDDYSDGDYCWEPFSVTGIQLRALLARTVTSFPRQLLSMLPAHTWGNETQRFNHSP